MIVPPVASRVFGDLPVPTQNPRHVASTVHQVLARPEYQHPGPSLLQRIENDVLDWLARTLSSVVGAGLGAWIAMAVILGLIAFVAWRVAGGVTHDPGRSVTVSAARRRPAADWRAEAEAHERAGEWRQALRCRYRALVADLAGRGLLEEVPGRTAGEYRAQLADSLPAAGPPFREATALFEGAWYGHRLTTEAETSRFRGLADAVVGAAR